MYMLQSIRCEFTKTRCCTSPYLDTYIRNQINVHVQENILTKFYRFLSVFRNIFIFSLIIIYTEV